MKLKARVSMSKDRMVISPPKIDRIYKIDFLPPHPVNLVNPVYFHRFMASLIATCTTQYKKKSRQRSPALPAGAALIDFRKRSLALPDYALDSSRALDAVTHAGSGWEERLRRLQHETRYCSCGRRSRLRDGWQSDRPLPRRSTNRRAAPGDLSLRHSTRPSHPSEPRCSPCDKCLRTIPTHCHAYRISRTHWPRPDFRPQRFFRDCRTCNSQSVA